MSGFGKENCWWYGFFPLKKKKKVIVKHQIGRITEGTKTCYKFANKNE